MDKRALLFPCTVLRVASSSALGKWYRSLSTCAPWFVIQKKKGTWTRTQRHEKRVLSHPLPLLYLCIYARPASNRETRHSSGTCTVHYVYSEKGTRTKSTENASLGHYPRPLYPSEVRSTM
ncbi:hypothetical protein V8C42DRAFT_305702 [Trichoderma barbatum]